MQSHPPPPQRLPLTILVGQCHIQHIYIYILCMVTYTTSVVAQLPPLGGSMLRPLRPPTRGSEGGIVVRSGVGLSSPEAAERLATGAVLQAPAAGVAGVAGFGGRAGG